jgi:hypothetical protein
VKKASSAKKNTLLYIVALVFVLQAGAWLALLIFAGKHKPAEVPLKTPAAHSRP